MKISRVVTAVLIGLAVSGSVCLSASSSGLFFSRMYQSDYMKVDMTKTDYAALEDIIVTMTGYACGAEGIDLTTAWESVKGNYGV